MRALATAAARARARVRDSGGHDIEIRVDSRDETLSLFCFDDLTLRHWEGPRERIQKAALVRMSIYLSIYLSACQFVCCVFIYFVRVRAFGCLGLCAIRRASLSSRHPQPDMSDTITLKTGDSETFTVARDVAMQSETIKNMLEGRRASSVCFSFSFFVLLKKCSIYV